MSNHNSLKVGKIKNYDGGKMKKCKLVASKMDIDEIRLIDEAAKKMRQTRSQFIGKSSIDNAINIIGGITNDSKN